MVIISSTIKEDIKMLKSFLRSLQVVNENEKDDWESFIREEFESIDDINILWYASCGTDSEIFYEFSEEKTDERRLPVVDVFICSDYDSKSLNLAKWYDDFDDKDIYFGNKQALITEIIPLKIFSPDEKLEINKRYKGKTNSSITDITIPDGPDFYYCNIELDDEYFPVFFTNIENTALLNEIILKWEIKLKYFCAVTDGCRKGGAWICMNEFDNEEFFIKLIESKCKPDYWITDHFRYKKSITDEVPKGFIKYYSIFDWGHYGDETVIYKIVDYDS